MSCNLAVRWRKDLTGQLGSCHHHLGVSSWTEAVALEREELWKNLRHIQEVNLCDLVTDLMRG